MLEQTQDVQAFNQLSIPVKPYDVLLLFWIFFDFQRSKLSKTISSSCLLDNTVPSLSSVQDQASENVAHTFTMKGFSHIIFLARNEQRLELDKATIVSKTERSDISIDTIKVDISDAAVLPGALRKLEKVGHTSECVFSARHVLFQASCKSPLRLSRRTSRYVRSFPLT